MVTIYSLTYSQNGSLAEDGPSIADFWSLEDATKACSSDCVVTPRLVTEGYADLNCEVF